MDVQFKTPQRHPCISRLLTKLEPQDNADFGREIHQEKREENVTNLINWLPALYIKGQLSTRGGRY